MTALPPELRALIESGPMLHLSTINPDGSPQVSVVWVGLDGDQPVTAHLRRQAKLRRWSATRVWCCPWTRCGSLRYDVERIGGVGALGGRLKPLRDPGRLDPLREHLR